MVVPTAGSYELLAPGAGLPIAQARRVVFGQAAGVHHCHYFSAAKTNSCLLAWLGET